MGVELGIIERVNKEFVRHARARNEDCLLLFGRKQIEELRTLEWTSTPAKGAALPAKFSFQMTPEEKAGFLFCIQVLKVDADDLLEIVIRSHEH